MEFSTRGSDNDNVELHIGSSSRNLDFQVYSKDHRCRNKVLNYNSSQASEDLTQYVVTNASMFKKPNDTFGTVRVEIELKRRIIETCITVYIPSFLICIICHFTVYFKPGLFKAVVTVNLTCLLCLVTLFIR